jgi:hypothetical protein
MNCKICNKSLYEQITFRNLLNIYDTHEKCEIKTKYFSSVFYIPFGESYLIINPMFEKEIPNMCYSYIEQKRGIDDYKNIISNNDWSIILYIDDIKIDDDFIQVLELIIYLGDKGILLNTRFHKFVYELESFLMKKIE